MTGFGERLAGGEDLVGAWVQLTGSAVGELLATVGFDFVCIDRQHGLAGPDALLGMLQGIHAAGTSALVRVPWNDRQEIGAALDAGADGVIVPLVDTAEQAAAAVAACRYPPVGRRSYGPSRAGWRGGPDPACIVMVETVDAVAALPGILAAGVDGVFVGPSDLALSAGWPTSRQDGDPEYDELVGGVARACAGQGVPVGIFAASPAHAHRFRAMGMSFFAVMSDASMLRAAAGGHLSASRPVARPT